MKRRTPLIVVSLCLQFCIGVSVVSAGSVEGDSFVVNSIVSDGKDGRVWRQWRQTVRETPIYVVEAEVSGIGQEETAALLKLRVGSNWQEEQEVLLNDSKVEKIMFKLNAVSPRGQPLVLSASRGEVMVKTITVEFAPVHEPSVPKPAVEKDDSDESCELDPQITVTRVKPVSGDASARIIAGRMAGSCVETAGYFENGQLQEKIPFPPGKKLQRQKFEVRVHTQKNGEIRIQTTGGREASLFIDEVSANDAEMF